MNEETIKLLEELKAEREKFISDIKAALKGTDVEEIKRAVEEVLSKKRKSLINNSRKTKG